jgi:uncharacterized membrane protein YccC
MTSGSVTAITAGSDMKSIWMLVQSCHTANKALVLELMSIKGSRERAQFGAQAVLSVALAVLLANGLHLSHTWWAAISGFAVMRDSLAGCVERGAQRVLGTLAGAAVGILACLCVGSRLWLFTPLLGCVGGYTVFRANGSRASYAWVLGGVTALMVMYDAAGLHAFVAILEFARSRVTEVFVGTLTSVFVSGVFQLMIHRRGKREPLRGQESMSGSDSAMRAFKPTQESPPDLRAILRARLLLGVEAGLAIAIVASLISVFHLPGFAQAMVTAIALLILPANALAERHTSAVVERIVQRLLGCLLAGVLGVGLLPVMKGEVLPCMLVLSAGVWLGCHVQTGIEGASYIGRQFTVAFIMVFVQDHQWSADPAPALMRLCGIAIGAVVLTCVMLAFRAMPFAREARKAEGDGCPMA